MPQIPPPILPQPKKPTGVLPKGPINGNPSTPKVVYPKGFDIKPTPKPKGPKRPNWGNTITDAIKAAVAKSYGATPVDYSIPANPNYGSYAVGTPVDFSIPANPNLVTAASNRTNPGGGGSGTVSNSSGGGGSGQSVQDLINELYNSLIGELTTQKEGSTAGYDAAKQTIQNQYEQAQKDLYQKYVATNNPLAIQAANLGVDYGNSSINAMQDAALKRLDETGDLSLASDQSYLDKMKLIQSGAFNALIQGSRNDQAAALIAAQQAALARTGSGHKGSGGGGGSSGGITGSTTDTAQTDYTYNDYARNEYDSIQRIQDPTQKALAELNWYANNFGSAGSKALYNTAQTPDIPVPSANHQPYSWGKNLVSAVKKGAAVQSNAAIDAKRKAALAEIRRQVDFYLKNPAQTTKVQTKGTEKKKYG